MVKAPGEVSVVMRYAVGGGGGGGGYIKEREGRGLSYSESLGESNVFIGMSRDVFFKGRRCRCCRW
jgi:hypothetical protein